MWAQEEGQARRKQFKSGRGGANLIHPKNFFTSKKKRGEGGKDRLNATFEKPNSYFGGRGACATLYVTSLLHYFISQKLSI
jgi:hypothetical protein